MSFCILCLTVHILEEMRFHGSTVCKKRYLLSATLTYIYPCSRWPWSLTWRQSFLLLLHLPLSGKVQTMLRQEACRSRLPCTPAPGRSIYLCFHHLTQYSSHWSTLPPHWSMYPHQCPWLVPQRRLE